MTKISANRTCYFKRIAPVLWNGFLAYWIVDVLINRKYEASLMLLFIPIFLLIVGYFISKKLISGLVDEVYDGGDFLIIKNRSKKEKIQLSDIKEITPLLDRNPKRVVLKLAQPGVFGAEIAFCPAAPFTLFAQSENQIADDLIRRFRKVRVVVESESINITKQLVDFK